MNQVDARRVEALFELVIQKSPGAERRALLDEACAGDGALRARLDQLLLAQDEMVAGFLPESPPRAGSAGGAGGEERGTGPAPVGAASVWIGRYKLLERIGEGGFGDVWMAEQRVPVKRRVAIKIIKPGMDSRQVVARMEAERQALAMMDHPNIARILDGGATESGSPYFVMELVRGIKITEFCDQHQLSTRDRLNLFIKVCQAVQHAHQKGIIHRDLKPSNVLVTMHDGPASAGIPKVIDFGIAKATQGELTDKTVFTQFQQFIGTPAYISPEQAEMRGLDIDTRADIYSLGVLLYEVLVGRTPFDPREMVKDGIDTLRQIIREKEPQKPSTRFRSLSPIDATTTAQRRSTDVGRLAHQMRGDLDWIVMKCLEKDRTRRYDTANGLAMDLQRYLANEPVVARPPSTAYRCRKWIRRNRLAFVASALVLLTLLGGAAAVILVQYRANADIRQRLYVSEMNHAGHEWLAGQSALLAPLLERCPPEHRDWEWRFLRQQVDRWEPLTVPLSTGELSGAVLSADGRYLAVGVADAVQFREMPSGRLVRELPFRAAWNAPFALSPRGDLLATAIASGVTVWNPLTGERVAELAGAFTGGLAWSGDDQLLAFSGPGPAIRLWDVRTGQERPAIAVPGRVRSLAFAPDDRTLAVGIDEIGVQCIDLGTGVCRRTLRTGDRTPTVLQFSPDGRRLATSIVSHGGHGADNRIWSLDPAEGSLDVTSSGDLVQFGFHPDNRQVAVADTSGTIRLWDLERRAEMERFATRAGPVLLVRWLPDGRLFSVGVQGIARYWTPRRTGNDQFRGYPDSLRTLAFSPDSRWLIAAGLAAGVPVWEARGGQLAGNYTGHVVEASAVAFSSRGRVATASDDQGIQIWDPLTMTNVWSRSLAPAPGAWSLGFSPDCRRLYAASKRSTVTILDAESGDRLATIDGLGNVIDGLAVSPDGRLLALGLKTKVSVWQADGSRELWQVAARPDRSVAFSPDGRWLAAGDRDGSIRLWEVASAGRTRQVWRGHAASVSGVSFHPGGHRLASAGMDGVVKIWDCRTGAELLTLPAPGSRILWHVAFSPDGSMVAAAGGDGVITRWKVE